MALGAYIFVLGAAMIAIGPLTSSYGLATVAADQLDAINLGLRVTIIGLILAPAGAAILAYGIGTSTPIYAEYESETVTPTTGETGSQ